MKKLLFIFFILISSIQVSAQETQKVWRANIVNPSFEYEHPITSVSTFSINIGVGYSGSYPNLSETSFQTGGLYAIAPFADLQWKRFYNLHKRANQNKVIDDNSGNFISIRFRTRGKSIDDNFVRKANYDFAIGPTWGIQRSYGNFHLLVDVGPQFYFDSKGDSGFWPIMPQINFGFDL